MFIKLECIEKIQDIDNNNEVDNIYADKNVDSDEAEIITYPMMINLESIDAYYPSDNGTIIHVNNISYDIYITFDKLTQIILTNKEL